MIPGLVLGLRHNMNQQKSGLYYDVKFAASLSAPVTHLQGGDRGDDVEAGRGYEWYMVNDQGASAERPVLPPGVVIGLRHSSNQSNLRITAWGQEILPNKSDLAGFVYKAGGDIGASNGQGYESTGEGFTDWSIEKRLPFGTIIGLKHSQNQSNKKLLWNGKEYDAANGTILPPPGYRRVFGGDRKAASGQGYFWYEKNTGPQVVSQPDLRIKLDKSMVLNCPDNALDKDNDYLIDDYENQIADYFRPYFVFDSDQSPVSRLYFEPVIIYQVRPVSIRKNSSMRIQIKWMELFRRDGGYGENSYCEDPHEGDNDRCDYVLTSEDNGTTWRISSIHLADYRPGPVWPINCNLELYDMSHPIIYISSNKHHQYFNTYNNHHNSYYSDGGCNDDVNGGGYRVLADLHSLHNEDNQNPVFNNVGEPESHPAQYFINSLECFYPGHGAWDMDRDFYSDECGKNGSLWAGFNWDR